MSTVKILSACFVLLTFQAATVEAKLYKWVDNQGVTHYGETIPPEYADKDNVLLDDKGRVIKKNAQLTIEERRNLEATAEKNRAEEAAAAEQRRRDRMLLSTYSSEKEIDLARDRNLQQVEALINSIQLLQKSANESAEGYQVEAQQISKAGKKIPASLKKDIADAEKKSTKLQQRLTKAQEKLAAVKAGFEADRVRYRELTGSGESKKEKL